MDLYHSRVITTIISHSAHAFYWLLHGKRTDELLFQKSQNRLEYIHMCCHVRALLQASNPCVPSICCCMQKVMTAHIDAVVFKAEDIQVTDEHQEFLVAGVHVSQ